MITTSFKLTKYFFDRAIVRQKLGEKQAKFLRNAGGYAQKTAQRSMRRVGKKGAPSKAGMPPKYHGGTPSLRTILYGLDPSRGSMVIGPVLLNGSRNRNPTIPALHEFGGTQTIRERKVGATWMPLGKKRPRPGQPVRRRMATYPARPFMRPARDKLATKFKQLWFGSGASQQAA